MKRRNFLKILLTSTIGFGIMPQTVFASKMTNHDEYIKDYLIKMKNFNKHHKGDIFLDKKQLPLIKSTVKRLKRLSRVVGYSNFHLLDLNMSLKYARNYSRIGTFSKDELNFLESIFYTDASKYGFMGEKPIKNFTDKIKRKDTIKVPYTGHYVYKGLPFETYKTIKNKLGKTAILTSGIRGVMKQLLLFLNKAYNNSANLSLASRQLAPPGYSFHGISDFDMGQVGYGALNFTAHFMKTDVYKKLEKFGFLKLRYPKSNLLGVRFEPWHIKMNSIT